MGYKSEAPAEPNDPLRPSGVWALTIYAGIFAGISPLVFNILLVITGNVDQPVSLLLSILLNIAIVYFAIGAWQGKNRDRKIFLAVLSAYYLLIGFNNFLIFSTQLIPEDEIFQVVGRILQGIFFPAIYLWYFNRPSTRYFYLSKYE
ncbi:MAG: hypothetical protein JXA13_09600 [Anaerolineales bacterium]|nr:hypothetical protein [Anaerolineales bacterium]